MNSYIGAKLIQACEAYKCVSTGKVIYKSDISEEDAKKKGYDEGYAVKYSDGYTSWSPKDVFEKAYLKVNPNPSLPSGVSISQEMVDNFIKEVHVDTIGEKTTLVRVELVNGFELTDSSSCVDKTNYDEKIGAECCLNKIKDKIWFLLGFLLQTAYKGVK